MRFFTSDTHFGHARISELAGRPFDSVEEMNETIIERWNSTVRPEDTVFHLGDVALGTIAESLPLVSRLNGIKHLVIGNHDRVFAGNKEAMRNRFASKYGEVFDTVSTDRTTIIDGLHVVLSHFPYDGDSQEDERYSEYRQFDQGIPLIHGHTHSKEIVTYSKKGTLQIHVGVDAWDFRPVSEIQILHLLETCGP